MSPSVYWVKASGVGRIAVVSRPDPILGLAQQMVALRDAGIDKLVSLLTANEAANVGLGDEAGAARTAGLDFEDFPIADFSVPPSFVSAAVVIDRLAAQLSNGRGVGVHCYAGRGRSPMFAAAILVHHGYSAEAAIDAVSTARGLRIPETPAQRQWIVNYTDWSRNSGPAG